MSQPESNTAGVNRRSVTTGAVAAGAAAIAGVTTSPSSAKEKPAVSTTKTTAASGKIKQSIVFWCFNAAGEKWSIDKKCDIVDFSRVCENVPL